VESGAVVAILILAGVMAAIFAAVVLITRRVGSGAEARADDLRAEVEHLGEGWEIPLQGASCLGSRRSFRNSKGNGVLGLTGRRVVFEPISGERVSVPLVRVVGARLGEWRRAAGAGRRRHLAIRLDDGDEVGFLVDDPEQWLGALAAADVAVEAPGERPSPGV